MFLFFPLACIVRWLNSIRAPTAKTEERCKAICKVLALVLLSSKVASYFIARYSIGGILLRSTWDLSLLQQSFRCWVTRFTSSMLLKIHGLALPFYNYPWTAWGIHFILNTLAVWTGFLYRSFVSFLKLLRNKLRAVVAFDISCLPFNQISFSNVFITHSEGNDIDTSCATATLSLSSIMFSTLNILLHSSMSPIKSSNHVIWTPP